MLLALGYVIYERLGRKTPLKTGCNPLDLPVNSPVYHGLFRSHECRHAVLLCPDFRLPRDCAVYALVLPHHAAGAQRPGFHADISGAGHSGGGHCAAPEFISISPLFPSRPAGSTHSESSVRTRVYSIFGSPNIMGDLCMTMFAPMAAGLAYYTKNRRLQVLAWLCAFCMCFGCLFTMSRGAWMALAIAIVIFVLLVDRRLLVLLIAAGCVACTLPFVRSRIGFLFTADFAEANTSGWPRRPQACGHDASGTAWESNRRRPRDVWRSRRHAESGH